MPVDAWTEVCRALRDEPFEMRDRLVRPPPIHQHDAQIVPCGGEGLIRLHGAPQDLLCLAQSPELQIRGANCRKRIGIGAVFRGGAVIGF